MVPPKKPKIIESNSFSSSNIEGSPSSIFRYINNAKTIAAKGAPGIPNKTVVIIEVAFWELLAPSQPITPLIFPLPKGIVGFFTEATVCPYASQSATAPPNPGRNPIIAPNIPPLREIHQFLNVA